MNKPKELQTTTQIIAREGFKPVGVCIVLMFLFIFLHFEFLALFALICAIFCAFIFRNTERIASYRGNDAIISPCDGVIKDIYTQDSTTAILFKINIFDNGIFRLPAYITRIKSAFRFGLFIKSDKNLQSILNTRHKVSGFLGDSHIFSITLLPEAWNKANIYALDNLSLGMQSAGFANEVKQPFRRICERSEATNTSIVIRDANQSAKNPSLRENNLPLPCGGRQRGWVDSANKTKNAEFNAKITHPLAPSAREGESTTNTTIFIGDRLGFMKYGYLLLEIHAPCKLVAQRGDNLFAGESLIGKFQANLY